MKTIAFRSEANDMNNVFSKHLFKDYRALLAL